MKLENEGNWYFHTSILYFHTNLKFCIIKKTKNLSQLFFSLSPFLWLYNFTAYPDIFSLFHFFPSALPLFSVLSLPFFFLFFVLPFSSNPTDGSQFGGATAWVSAWRSCVVSLGLEELRRESQFGGATAWVGLEGWRLTVSALSKPISAWPENFGFGFVCLSKPISDLKILVLFAGEFC